MTVANKKRIKVNEPRPEYLIQVRTDWRYPRGKFWSIQRYDEKRGYWYDVTRGLAYTKWGMRRAINKRLKKMKVGYTSTQYTLDGNVFKGIK